MLRYTIRRLLQIIPVFFIATFLIFIIVWVLPGDPIQAQFGERTVPDNTRIAYEERYNLNDSLPVQYWKYITGIIFHLDFGESLRTQRPVKDLFIESFPRTLRLAGLAVFFEAIMAVPIGIYAARKRGGWFDNGALVSTIFLLSIPPFVMLALLQLLVGVKWGLLPVSGIDEGMKSYLLPAFGIAIGAMAGTSRLMRASLIETYQEDYIKTARAKGASEKRGPRHPRPAQRVHPDRDRARYHARRTDRRHDHHRIDLPDSRRRIPDRKIDHGPRRLRDRGRLDDPRGAVPDHQPDRRHHVRTARPEDPL